MNGACVQPVGAPSGAGAGAVADAAIGGATRRRMGAVTGATSSQTLRAGLPEARPHSRWRRIARRLPLRLASTLIKQIARVDHRTYMRLLLPVLRRGGMHLRGTPRYLAPTVFFDDLDRISLGDRVVISSHASLLTHDYSWTTMLIAAGRLDGADEAVVRGIEIGDNVFVGRAALLMPGTKLGDHVIVGAGSVVRGEVPSRSVVMGNPASVIGTIDDLLVKQLQKNSLDLRKDVVA